MQGINISISLLDNPKKNLIFASAIPKINVSIDNSLNMSHEAFIVEELVFADTNSVKFFVIKTKV